MSICDIVFSANEDAAGPIGSTRHLEQSCRTSCNWFRELPHHMVETQIKLVEDQKLLHLFECLTTGILVHLGVVDFQCGKDGILVADVEGNKIENQRLRFVGF